MSLVSVLHTFAYGQVVEDNKSQSRSVKVKVLDHLPSQYGHPIAEERTETIEVETLEVPIWWDNKGSEKLEQRVRPVTVTLKNYVNARWLNRSANKISPPTLVCGQRVLLWRVGDSREYYWEELDVDVRLKPEEHIVIAINNHNEGKKLDIDNAYIIEMSTRDKRVRVRTNRNNGEKAAFEVDINGAEGFLKIVDDCKKSGSTYMGNGMLIDSVNTIVKLSNVSGTSWLLDGGDAKLKAESYSVDADSIKFSSSTFDVEAESSFVGITKINKTIQTGS